MEKYQAALQYINGPTSMHLPVVITSALWVRSPVEGDRDVEAGEHCTYSSAR